MIFCTAILKIDNAELAMSKIEKPDDVNLVRKLERIPAVFFQLEREYLRIPHQLFSMNFSILLMNCLMSSKFSVIMSYSSS